MIQQVTKGQKLLGLAFFLAAYRIFISQGATKMWKSTYKYEVWDNVDREFIRSHYSTYDVKKDLRRLCKTWSMVSDKHFDFAVDAISQLNAMKIQGDVVEAGVWKGGMSMAMALTNQQDNTHRHFWLFDTFEGLPPPTSNKDDPKAKMVYGKLKHYNENENGGEIDPEIEMRMGKKGIENGKWNYGPLDVVKHNMYYTGYPKDHLHFIQGKVEETLYDTSIKLPEKIAMLRVDTDWYDSTKAELDVLWSRLESGGVFICDDYFTWKGAKTAVDEFFMETLGLNASAHHYTNAPRKLHGVFHYWKP